MARDHLWGETGRGVVVLVAPSSAASPVRLAVTEHSMEGTPARLATWLCKQNHPVLGSSDAYQVGASRSRSRQPCRFHFFSTISANSPEAGLSSTIHSRSRKLFTSDGQPQPPAEQLRHAHSVYLIGNPLSHVPDGDAEERCRKGPLWPTRAVHPMCRCGI
ncbi:hypothetical protein VTK56DRAFT_8329 [Thermocarpiscus australiensis]